MLGMGVLERTGMSVTNEERIEKLKAEAVRLANTIDKLEQELISINQNIVMLQRVVTSFQIKQ